MPLVTEIINFIVEAQACEALYLSFSSEQNVESKGPPLDESTVEALEKLHKKYSEIMKKISELPPPLTAQEPSWEDRLKYIVMHFVSPQIFEKLLSYDDANNQHSIQKGTNEEVTIALSHLACAIEKTGDPKEQAHKLYIVFGDQVLQYLRASVQNNPDFLRPFHSACSFRLPPDSHKWSRSVWRELALRDDTFVKDVYFRETLFPAAARMQKIFMANKGDVKLGGGFKKETTLDALTYAYEKYLFFENITPQNKKTAELFRKNHLTQEAFNTYNGLTLAKSKNIPALTIIAGKFYLKKLEPTDRRAAYLGKLVNCCQSLGCAGESCVIHGITSDNGGFYVICKQEKKSPKLTDKIISVCWVWRSNMGAIVLDSIESLKEDFERDKYNIIALYQKLANCLVQVYDVPQVMLGTGGGTPEESPWADASLYPFNPQTPVDYQGYSDAGNQKILAIRGFPVELLNLSEENSGIARIKVAEYLSNLVSDIPGDGVRKQRPGLIDLPHFVDWIAVCIQKEDLHSLTFMRHYLPEDRRQEFDTLVKDNTRVYDFCKPGVTMDMLDDLEKMLHAGVSLELVKQGNENLMLQFLMSNPPPQNSSRDIDGAYSGIDSDLFSSDSDNETKITPPPMSVSKSGKNYEDLIKKLKKTHANMSEEDKVEMLFFALEQKNWDIVRWLIENKVNLHARNHEQKTTLLAAAESGHIEMVNALLNYGVNKNARDSYGFTALMRAAMGGVRAIVMRMRDEGLDVNAQAKDGNTAILIAYQYGKLDVVAWLFENGANLNIENNRQETLLNLAVRNKDKRMLGFLINHTPLLRTALERGKWDLIDALLKIEGSFPHIVSADSLSEVQKMALFDRLLTTLKTPQQI